MKHYFIIPNFEPYFAKGIIEADNWERCCQHVDNECHVLGDSKVLAARLGQMVLLLCLNHSALFKRFRPLNGGNVHTNHHLFFVTKKIKANELLYSS